MELYQVKIAYDGTLFFGFQRQGNARTVQSEIENVLRQFKWTGKSILCAGRTDTGVHASGQVITFELDWQHGTETLLKALNAKMPKDIAVDAVRVADAGFHPRYSAISRCYHYRIYCQPNPNPLRDRFAWRVWPPASLAPMQTAANTLLGTHDFSAFGAPTQKGGHTIRTVIETSWTQMQPDEYHFCVRANAFLYHMVRRLVYLQVKIGQGLWDTENFRQGVENQFPQQPGLAKPNGLILVEVQYQTPKLD
jgi:tRNA pseudouridine38-40 synthase